MFLFQMIVGFTGFAGLVTLPRVLYTSSGTMKYKCWFSVAFVSKCMERIRTVCLCRYADVDVHASYALNIQYEL